MSKFIVASPNVELTDPMSGQVIRSMPWSECIVALFMDARFQKMLDLFPLIDLRAKLKDLHFGMPAVMITDQEAEALATICQRPEIFQPNFLFSPGAEEFFRAFTDAPSKHPLKLAAADDSPNTAAS